MKIRIKVEIKAIITALILLVGILSITVLFAALFTRKDEKETQRTYLVGGNLIKGTNGAIIENSLVILQGNKILYAGKNKSIEKMPSGKVIDCSGKTLLPGLFDTHIHLGGSCSLAYIPTSDQNKLNQFLYSGVTSVFDLGTIEAWIFDLREKEKKEETISPRIFAVGPLFTSPGGHGTEYGVPMALTPTTEEEARDAVRNLIPKKPEYIKIIYEKGSERFTSLNYGLMKAIIDESHKNKIKVITHTLTLEQTKDALRAGTDGLAHIVIDKKVDEELLRAMKKDHIFCIPTIAVFEYFSGSLLRSKTFLEWPLIKEGVSPDILDDLKAKSDIDEIVNNPSYKREILSTAKINLKKMADAGIKLVLGTDAGNPAVFFGPSVHRELELYVEAGLSPLAAITAATKNAAEMLGVDDKIGIIESGMLADILVTNGNPLENIKNTQNIFLVIKNGKIIERNTLAEKISPPKNPPVPTLDLPIVFDDFEDNNYLSNWETEWEVLTDKAAGGSSTAAIKCIQGGAEDSKHALQITGKVTTKIPFVFAGVVAPFGNEPGKHYDVSSYTGIKFKTRGDHKNYRVVISSAAVKDYDDFFYTFTADKNWEEIIVPFSELKQFGFGKKVDWTGKDILTLQFMTFGAPHDKFELNIDDIKFYK